MVYLSKVLIDSKEKLEEIKKEFSDTFEGHTDVNNLINSLSNQERFY